MAHKQKKIEQVNQPISWHPDIQYDKNGVMRDLADPKYKYTVAQKKALRTHMQSGGTWKDMEMIERIYATGSQAQIAEWENAIHQVGNVRDRNAAKKSNDVDIIDNTSKDIDEDEKNRREKTGKYSPDTEWGAEYQKAISEGYSHEIAVIWSNGKFADRIDESMKPKS